MMQSKKIEVGHNNAMIVIKENEENYNSGLPKA